MTATEEAAASRESMDVHDVDDDINVFDCDGEDDDDPTEPSKKDDEVVEQGAAAEVLGEGRPVPKLHQTSTSSSTGRRRPMSKVEEEKVSKAALDTLRTRTNEDQDPTGFMMNSSSPGAIQVVLETPPPPDEIVRSSNNKSCKSSKEGRRTRTSDDPLPSLAPKSTKSTKTGKIHDRTSRASRGTRNNVGNDDDDNAVGSDDDDDDGPGAFAIAGLLPSTSSQSIVVGGDSGHLTTPADRSNNNGYDEEIGGAAMTTTGAEQGGGDDVSTTASAIVAELVPKENDVLAHIEEQVAERLEKEREKQVIAEATTITVSSSRKTRLVRWGLLGLLLIFIGISDWTCVGCITSRRRFPNSTTNHDTHRPSNHATIRITDTVRYTRIHGIVRFHWPECYRRILPKPIIRR